MINNYYSSHNISVKPDARIVSEGSNESLLSHLEMRIQENDVLIKGAIIDLNNLEFDFATRSEAFHVVFDLALQNMQLKAENPQLLSKTTDVERNIEFLINDMNDLSESDFDKFLKLQDSTFEFMEAVDYITTGAYQGRAVEDVSTTTSLREGMNQRGALLGNPFIQGETRLQILEQANTLFDNYVNSLEEDDALRNGILLSNVLSGFPNELQSHFKEKIENAGVEIYDL